ncbi:MAG: metallophosphoesterase family protein [Vicinamibacterales bacterium]
MARRPSVAVTVGLIADTHGLLRPQALEVLVGSDFIIHAGDVGDATILDQLAAIAPVTVVRGNVDDGPEAAIWPETAVLTLGVVQIYVLHDLSSLAIDPAADGYHAVIYGHSHKPVIERRGAVWFINPGSAGPRRFSLPISVGSLQVHGTEISATNIELRL